MKVNVSSHTKKQVVADVCTHSAAVCQFQCQHLRKTTARRGKINPNLYMVDLWWFERFISLSWLCQAESIATRKGLQRRSSLVGVWCNQRVDRQQIVNEIGKGVRYGDNSVPLTNPRVKVSPSRERPDVVFLCFKVPFYRLQVSKRK